MLFIKVLSISHTIYYFIIIVINATLTWYIMNGFATLDDSTVDEKGLFVYTHALVLNHERENPIVQVFFDKGNIKYKGKEKPLKDFIEDNLPEDYDLFACSHYMMYPSFWDDLVLHPANLNGINGHVKRQHRHYSHVAAKSTSRRFHGELYHMKKQVPNSGFFITDIYLNPHSKNNIIIPSLSEIVESSFR